MRQLHILGSAKLSSGGPVEGVRQTSVYLKRLGHSVDILSLDTPDANDIAYLGVPVHSLGLATSSFGYSPKVAKWLEAHLENYDVLIVHGLWQYPGLPTRRIALKHKIPYFVFTHGMLDPWFNEAYPLKKLKKMAFWPWQHPVLRDARAVLFTTEDEKILARRSFRPYRVTERVVPYGTSAPPAPAPEHEAAFNAAVPNIEGKRVLLSLGRIHPKKGHDILIEAFAAVMGSRPEWVLVIAGPDQTGWKPQLIELAKKLGVDSRICWPGMLKGDAKWGAFRASDAFILPSHQENFGISVAEALSCAKPVFISDKVNIWREIQAEDAGRIQSDTLEGTKALLEELAQMSKEELKELGARAELCFNKNFEASRMATGLLEAIQELA
jgi:glycosyltransferase involved in cell wall biosynthesis